MALHVKLHEKFSAPLSPDYWYTNTMQGVVVSGGYARVPTTQNPAVYVQPQWFKPDWSPLSLYGKRGVNWGEIELEVKITPRHQRQSGATNTNQMGTYIRNYPIDDDSFRYINASMWSRVGTGTGTEFGLRFYSSGSPDATLYEHTNVPVNTPIWLRLYLNKATGRIRFSTSNNGTSWTERYSAIDPHHITDGDANAYLTPTSGGPDKYYDIDDFILRTSNAEVLPSNARVESSVSEIELSVTHHLEIDSSSSSTSSSSPVPSPELDVADTALDHEVQSAKLKQLHGLLPASPKHSHSVNGVSLRQQHDLAIDDAINWYNSTDFSLVEDYLLLADSTLHSMYAPNVPVSGAAFLGVHNAYHSLRSTNAALTQLYKLGTQDSLHGLSSGELDITESRLLAIQSSLHSLKSIAGKLYQNHVTAPQGASHGLADSAILLKQAQLLYTRNGHHSARSTGLLNLIHFALLGKPDDASHKLLSPQFGLSQHQVLELSNTLHRLKDERARIMNLTEMGIGSGQYKETYSQAGGFRDLVNYIFESEDEIFLFEDEQGYGVLVPEQQRRTLSYIKTYKLGGDLGVITLGPEQAFTKNYKQKGRF